MGKWTFESIWKNIDNTINNTKEKAKNTANIIKNKIKLTWNTIVDYWKKVKKSAEKTYDKASKSINKSIEKWLLYIDSVKAQINNISSSIANKANDLIKQAWQAWEKMWYIIYWAALNYWKKLKDLSYNVKTWIATIVLKTWEIIKINVINPAINSAKNAQKIIETSYYTAKWLSLIVAERVVKIKQRIDKKAIEVLDSSLNTLKNLWTRWIMIYEKALNILEQAWANIKNVSKIITAAIKRFWWKISNFVYEKWVWTLKIILNTWKNISIKVKDFSNKLEKDIIAHIEYLENVWRKWYVS